MTAEERAKLDQLGKAITDLSIGLEEIRKLVSKQEVEFIGKATEPSENKLDQVDHLLLVLRVVNRQPVDQSLKHDMQNLVVKSINEILK